MKLYCTHKDSTFGFADDTEYGYIMFNDKRLMLIQDAYINELDGETVYMASATAEYDENDTYTVVWRDLSPLTDEDADESDAADWDKFEVYQH